MYYNVTSSNIISNCKTSKTNFKHSKAQDLTVQDNIEINLSSIIIRGNKIKWKERCVPFGISYSHSKSCLQGRECSSLREPDFIDKSI